MITQDVEKVFHQWADTDEKGYKDLTFRGFDALVIEAIRELKDGIESRIKTPEDKLKSASNPSYTQFF